MRYIALSILSSGLLFYQVPKPCAVCAPCFSDDPASVLLVVNDATIPETGTGSKGASQYVADVYRTLRRVPSRNVAHINVALSGNDPVAFDSWNITCDAFKSQIRAPIKTHMESEGIKDSIRYIVPTYGVPTHVNGCLNIDKQSQSNVSVDAMLAQMYRTDADTVLRPNAYYNSVASAMPSKHFAAFSTTYRQYLVTRLDGPSALVSATLAVKAVTAEKNGVDRTTGVGYFDWRHIAGTPDATVSSAYNLCVAAGFDCILNDQTVTGGMITDGTDALWVWGWYSGNATNDVYTFQSGAVGSQLTSYTANNIRGGGGGNWCHLFLTRGITATWGATGEPTTAGFANGDALLNRLWNGYNFAEAGWSANPYTGWMMVFVGDPLYRPRFYTGEEIR